MSMTVLDVRLFLQLEGITFMHLHNFVKTIVYILSYIYVNLDIFEHQMFVLLKARVLTTKAYTKIIDLVHICLCC